MARYRNRRSRRNWRDGDSNRSFRRNRSSVRRSRSKKSKYHELQTFAYNYGRMQRGMANQDSLIYESYQKGSMSPEKRKKARKSLFGGKKEG